MRRLLPDAAETSVAEQVASLDLVSRAHDERPYLVTNFALTLDGHATISGRSGPIGSATDTAMLVGLRTRVDAVMIGAGTMRAERYGRVVADPAKRERRVADGLEADPLTVIVSGRLDLPWEAPLFADGDGPVLLVTNSDVEPPETTTPVEVLRQEGELDLAAMLAQLRHERGVRALLCEGGPHVHAQLIDADLVDELFVTHAPKLAGGAGPGLVAGLDERTRAVELSWLLAEPPTGELFGRYTVKRDA
jgi:riboflavin-specific deaminase-like protein